MNTGGFTIVYSVKPSRGVLSGRASAKRTWMQGLKVEKVFPDTAAPSRGPALAKRRATMARDPEPGSDETLYVLKSGDIGSTQAALERLKEDPDIEFFYVAPLRAALGAKAPMAMVGDWHNQVGLAKAQTLRQWKDGKHRVSVGVVDTGVDLAHPQLSHFQVVEHHPKQPPKPDPIAHGSHVSGLIAATFNGGNQFRGLAENLVDLIVHRGIAGRYDVAAYYRALRAACSSRLVNLSLGGIGEDKFESQIIARSIAEDDTIFVVAAGNEGELGSPENFPAACPDVIAVANVDRRGKRAPSSNANAYVFTAAPGENIISTVPTYPVRGVKWVASPPLAEMSGTSMATPIVTATIARMLAYKPKLTRLQVIDYIKQTSKQPRNKQTGYGCINVHDILALL